MKLGRVVGTVVSTRKDEKIESLKLYVVRDLSLDLGDKDSFVIAADAMGAPDFQRVVDLFANRKRVPEGASKRRLTIDRKVKIPEPDVRQPLNQLL